MEIGWRLPVGAQYCSTASWQIYGLWIIGANLSVSWRLPLSPKRRETPDFSDPLAAIGSRQLAGWVRGFVRPVVNATMSTIEGM